MGRGSCRDRRHRHPRPRGDRGRRTTAPPTSPASGTTRRKRAERRLGLLLVRPGGDHHARGRRVPDPLRVLALVEQGRPAHAERQRVHLVRQLRHRAVQPDLVDGVRRHPVHHHRQRVASSWCSGCCWRIVMHRTIVGRGLVRTSALVPYAIVTVVAAFSWRFAWTQDLGYLTPSGIGAAHRVLAVDLDHHPGRGLEDRPVHGAAADGRPGPGARGPAQGGLDGRRDRLEAVLADHRAADQAGHPGGAAVPHPGRVPGLRQHLRPHQRRQRAPARCRWSPTAT